MAQHRNCLYICILLQILTCVLGYHELHGVFYLHTPNCNGSGVELIPKSDCSGFYICADGRTYEETCQDGWVFSHGAHGCVPRGTFIDDCETIEDTCASDPDGIHPHVRECQLYYNCSNNVSVSYFVWQGAFGGPVVTEPFLQECPYPEVFNVETLTCDDFRNVLCGTRNEIVDKCKYWTHKSYHGVMARPCSADSPSCEGLPDGGNVFTVQSPYLIECFEGRTINTGRCPPLNVSDMAYTQLFHPELRRCAPLYLIPKEHGGYMPDCSVTPNGRFSVDFGHCRYYYVCMDGAFDDVYACDDGMLFDTNQKTCVAQELAMCG